MIEGISVVIPNYNGISLLPQILPPALKALERTRLPFEVIVVDDCSTDQSVQLLGKDFPWTKVITNKKNSGFSVTANVGIRSAKFPWVLLLNSDVKLEPDYFEALIKYTTSEKVFGVMGRIVGWEDDVVQDGAKYPFFHGGKIKTSGNYLLADPEQMRKGLYSMYVSGANAFLNRDIFERIGGFNEIFSPYYAEDTELSFRAWRLGYTCWYEYFSLCRHKTSSTILTAHKKKKVNIVYNRNKMYLHAIHLDGWARYVWMAQLMAEVLMRTILLKWGYTQSFIQFVVHYPKVRASRRQLNRLAGSSRLLTVKEFFQVIQLSLQNQKITRL